MCTNTWNILLFRKYNPSQFVNLFFFFFIFWILFWSSVNQHRYIERRLWKHFFICQASYNWLMLFVMQKQFTLKQPNKLLQFKRCTCHNSFVWYIDKISSKGRQWQYSSYWIELLTIFWNGKTQCVFKTQIFTL